MTLVRKRKAIVFEGREFASVRAFKAEFPAYKTYTPQIMAGADTVMALERHIAEINARARAKNRAGIKAARAKPVVFGKRR